MIEQSKAKVIQVFFRDTFFHFAVGYGSFDYTFWTKLFGHFFITMLFGILSGAETGFVAGFASIIMVEVEDGWRNRWEPETAYFDILWDFPAGVLGSFVGFHLLYWIL